LSQILVPAAVTETIDDLECVVVPFPALHALGLLARLMRSLGPALGALHNADEADDLSKLAPALASLTPEEIKALALEILKQTHVWIDDGSGTGRRKIELATPQKVDLVFSGRVKTLFRVLGLALRVNFASFVDGSASAPSAPLPAS
jgi:hypothetical protein